MISKNSKKAAMEMSVGTIVTIVLLMSVLVLGLVLVRTIFSSGVSSINQIDGKVRSAIDNLFLEDDDARMAIYPSDQRITIEQGEQGAGFAFEVRNVGYDSEDFTFTITVDEQFNIRDKCRINANEAEEWLIIDSGSFSLGGSRRMIKPELVLFNIPVTAPACTIPFKVEVSSGSERDYESLKVYLTIEAK